MKSLVSTHTALLLTSKGGLPTEPMERRVQKITHRIENSSMQIVFLIVGNAFGLSHPQS